MRCLSVSIDIVNAINAKDTIRLYRKGENMRKFDENLLEKSEIMDTLLSPFGENAPKKRLLVIDYKEQGVDKHINLAAYQYKGMTDQDLISSLIDTVHKRPDGTARKRFNDNRRYFVSGVDFYRLTQPSEIRTLGITRPQGGTPNEVTLLKVIIEDNREILKALLVDTEMVLNDREVARVVRKYA